MDDLKEEEGGISQVKEENQNSPYKMGKKGRLPPGEEEEKPSNTKKGRRAVPVICSATGFLPLVAKTRFSHVSERGGGDADRREEGESLQSKARNRPEKVLLCLLDRRERGKKEGRITTPEKGPSSDCGRSPVSRSRLPLAERREESDDAALGKGKERRFAEKGKL